MDFPSLSEVEIEVKASSLLESYFSSIKKPLTTPIPVEVIAESYLGYDIEFVDDGIFANPNVLGGIVFDKNVIYVNVTTEPHEGRYNFTIAHEIGHHTLHRSLIDGSEVICRESDTRPIEEAQADRFAAALLMPASFVKHAVAALGEKPTSSNVKAIRGYASRIAKEAKFSNVSNTAVINRLIDLGYLPSSSGYYSSFRKNNYTSKPLLKSLLHKAFKRFYR